MIKQNRMEELKKEISNIDVYIEKKEYLIGDINDMLDDISSECVAYVEGSGCSKYYIPSEGDLDIVEELKSYVKDKPFSVVSKPGRSLPSKVDIWEGSSAVDVFSETCRGNTFVCKVDREIAFYENIKNDDESDIEEKEVAKKMIKELLLLQEDEKTGCIIEKGKIIGSWGKKEPKELNYGSTTIMYYDEGIYVDGKDLEYYKEKLQNEIEKLKGNISKLENRLEKLESKKSSNNTKE